MLLTLYPLVPCFALLYYRFSLPNFVPIIAMIAIDSMYRAPTVRTIFPYRCESASSISRTPPHYRLELVARLFSGFTRFPSASGATLRFPKASDCGGKFRTLQASTHAEDSRRVWEVLRKSSRFVFAEQEN